MLLVFYIQLTSRPLEVVLSSCNLALKGIYKRKLILDSFMWIVACLLYMPTNYILCNDNLGPMTPYILMLQIIWKYAYVSSLTFIWSQSYCVTPKLQSASEGVGPQIRGGSREQTFPSLKHKRLLQLTNKSSEEVHSHIQRKTFRVLCDGPALWWSSRNPITTYLVLDTSVNFCLFVVLVLELLRKNSMIIQCMGKLQF